MRGARIWGIIVAASTVISVATATAAVGPTVHVTVTPQRGGAVSGLHLAADGPFTSGDGLPQFMSVTLQKGFGGSVLAKKVLCNSAQASAGSCPSASQVGTASAQVTVDGSIPDTISFKLYLGQPGVGGIGTADIWSMSIIGQDSLLHQTFTASGRLFKGRGGTVGFHITHLPQISGVTLDSFRLNASAKRRRIPPPERTPTGMRYFHHKRTFGLLTNPRRCPTGHWTGDFLFSFADGHVAKGGLRIPCH